MSIIESATMTSSSVKPPSRAAPPAALAPLV
jgi:hypothetical protein